jgi:hypothetical protein
MYRILGYGDRRTTCDQNHAKSLMSIASPPSRPRHNLGDFLTESSTGNTRLADMLYNCRFFIGNLTGDRKSSPRLGVPPNLGSNSKFKN